MRLKDRSYLFTGISNKILLVVLSIILFFTIGLSIFVGVTSFSKFTDITMDHLTRVSAIFAQKIGDIETQSSEVVRTFNENVHFLEQVRQLTNNGPLYGLDTKLTGQDIEASEQIYFFQSQLKLINLLLPLFRVNNLDRIVIYLSSPFNMVTIPTPLAVMEIGKEKIYVNQFTNKGLVDKKQWYKIDTQAYTPPPPDYFDISSVYSLSLDKFILDTGFKPALPGEVRIPKLITEGGASGGSVTKLVNGTPLFDAWNGITVPTSDPNTFEEVPSLAGYILVEQELSNNELAGFKKAFGMDLGIGVNNRLIMPKTEQEILLAHTQKRIKMGNTEYYFAKTPIPLNGTLSLTAISLRPVSDLNAITRSLSLQIAFIGVVVMLVAGTILSLVVRIQIRTPLKKLMIGVDRIARGKLDSNVTIGSKDEFGKLAVAFNDMASSLEIKNSGLLKALDELEKAQNYIGSILDSMPSIIIGVDAGGRITQWNDKASTTLNISAQEAKGKPLVDIFPLMASQMNTIEESISSQQIIQDQKKPRTTEQGTCYDDIIIYPLVEKGVEGAVIRIDDVTEKVRLEELIVQNEKMLSVGGLAAGMAHEINNPLAGMLQTANVLGVRLTNLHIPANIKAAEKIGIEMNDIRLFMEDRGIDRMVTTINKSGERISAIVNNMLSFSRKSDELISSHVITELIEKTLELAATDFDLRKKYDFKNIAIIKEYQEDLPSVVCEDTKIQQVLLNIFKNGSQALQEAKVEKPHFIIRVRTARTEEMIHIEIEDNGPGMDEETTKRVFEPFFTTKPVDVGTGLGLSVSYFIITENHGGDMSVESTPNVGTTFIIRLPLRNS